MSDPRMVQFIGGPWDGKWLTIDGEPREYYVAMKVPVSFRMPEKFGVGQRRAVYVGPDLHVPNGYAYRFSHFEWKYTGSPWEREDTP